MLHNSTTRLKTPLNVADILVMEKIKIKVMENIKVRWENTGMPAIALSPSEELAHLEHHLGSKAAIGRVIGRDPAVVSRWMAKKSKLNPTSRSLVDAAYLVVTCLTARGYEEADLEAVLTRPWTGLANQVPAELIARRDVAPILDALNSRAGSERTPMPTQAGETTKLAAVAHTEPITLDPRLAGHHGYPEATAERVNLLRGTEPSIPEPQGSVRGVVHNQALTW